MTTSQIVDKLGNPFVIEKSATAPNLDPDFFLMDDANSGSSKDVVSMPYAYHVWIHSCVRAISQNIAQLDRTLRNKKTGTINDEHAILSLLARPNTVMTQMQFFKVILCQLLLPATKGGVVTGGQSFIIPWNTIQDDKVNLAKGEIPNELFPYPETYFEPWYGEERKGRNQLKGWTFRIPQVPDSIINFEHGEIIRMYLVNPYNILKGISPFSSVATAVELDAKADIFNSDIFANSGRLDGQVSSEQYIPKEELDKFKEEWYKQYTGLRRKRVAFLSGGMKFEQYALSSVDLQYVEQEKWSRAKVLGAYGLNRIAVGDYEDVNYATIKEGRKILWYDTYIPLDKMLLDALNNQWINYVEQGIYQLISDYSKVPALQADMQDRVKTGGILVTQMGYPPSLASRIVELPLKEEDIKKWPHLDEKQQNSVSAFPSMIEEVPIKSINKTINKDYSQEYINKVLDPAEKSFLRNLNAFFVRQRNSIMDNVDAWLKKNPSKGVTKEISVSAWEFLPNVIQENLELLKIYKPAVKTQIALEKKQVEHDLGHGIEWDAGSTRVQYWTNARSAYMEDINTTTFQRAGDAIDATIRQGMTDGLTPSEMAREIKQAVHDVYEVRFGKPVVPHGDFDLGGMSSSSTIARTEMGTIASLTRSDIFKEEGIEKIQWVSSGDERVRESHDIDEIIDFGDTFSNGLRYPRDQQGEPGEIINCRCAFIAVIEGTGATS
jgi:SPP1 gp7 family putative phage head morphogenesis protein